MLKIDTTTVYKWQPVTPVVVFVCLFSFKSVLSVIYILKAHPSGAFQVIHEYRCLVLDFRHVLT